MMQFNETCFLDSASVKRTADGYLVAQPRVARTGIQIYSPKEVGKPEFDRLVRVYRPEGEVFSQDTIKSFAHRPVTMDHPPEMVDAKNWGKYTKGHTVDPIVRDGEFVRVPVMLMDAATISAWEGGKKELSMGYTCDLKWEAGTTDDGEEYDAVQTNLRMNHLAIVGSARGGDKLRIGDNENYWDRDFTAEQRQNLAEEGKAMPGGRYPIANKGDLQNAIHAIGRGKGSHEAIRAHIIKRARALGATSMLPEEWNVSDEMDTDYMPCPECQSPVSEDDMVCENCGYHLPMDMTEDDVTDGFYFVEDFGNPNHYPAGSGKGGQFAPGSGGSGGSYPVPKNPRSKVGLQAHGYKFYGGNNQPKYVRFEPNGPNGEGVWKAGPFNSIEEAINAASGHFKSENQGSNVASEKVHPASSLREVAAKKAASNEPDFKAGRNVFSTYQAAKQHIRFQRRRWNKARIIRTPAAYVPRRGFGFTHGAIPGLRKLVNQPKFTLSHDEAPWMILFDEALDSMPLSDIDLTEVEIVDFNQNHNPETGEFTSSEGIVGKKYVEHLKNLSRSEAATSTFSSEAKAREQASKQLETWKKNAQSLEEALKEIKLQQKKWEKAKVFTFHKETPKSGFFSLRHRSISHYTVGVDSMPEVELTETDLLQARQLDEQMEIEERV